MATDDVVHFGLLFNVHAVLHGVGVFVHGIGRFI